MTDTSPPSITGPWALPEIEEFLRSQVIPVRLASVSSQGWPVIVSLWFLYEEGVIHCATRPSTRIVSLLEKEPRCGFEIAGETLPYFGIRGQAMAQVRRNSGGRILESLVERYLGRQDNAFQRWLLKGAADEAAIEITPVRVMTWDYRARMAAHGS